MCVIMAIKLRSQMSGQKGVVISLGGSWPRTADAHCNVASDGYALAVSFILTSAMVVDCSSDLSRTPYQTITADLLGPEAA